MIFAARADQGVAATAVAIFLILWGVTCLLVPRVLPTVRSENTARALGGFAAVIGLGLLGLAYATAR